MKSAKFGIHMTLRYGSNGALDGEHAPVMRNIDIRDSSFSQLTKQSVFIEGYAPTNQISDVTIANCDFAPVRGGTTITNAMRINLVNCRGLASK